MTADRRAALRRLDDRLAEAHVALGRLEDLASELAKSCGSLAGMWAPGRDLATTARACRKLLHQTTRGEIRWKINEANEGRET